MDDTFTSLYNPSSALRPASRSPKDLLLYCVTKAMKDNLLGASLTHKQWAYRMFSYDKTPSFRLEMMSSVKSEYPVYFSKLEGGKYRFLEDKLRRDFPSMFGEDVRNDEEYTCEEIIDENIESLDKEIIEEKNPKNVETFRASDFSLVKKQDDSYIYRVTLLLPEGDEPAIHEGAPFELLIYKQKFPCEIVDYDDDSAILSFTSKKRMNSAKYCKVILDSTFNIEGLRKRLVSIKDGEINESLPFTKFLYGETRTLKSVQHAPVHDEYVRYLDASQRKAFKAAINKDITFIWGPPGTGKSFTLASIIYALFSMNEGRTAVCCLSNIAVDQLLNKVLDIIENGRQQLLPGNLYRAGRSLDERILATDYLFPEDEEIKIIRREIQRNNEIIKTLKQAKQDKTERAISIKAKNQELRKELAAHTDYLVNGSKVVFSTISNFVLSDRLSNSHFDNLIVDEASMLSMPNLIAIGSKISRRIIMVGDFQQLSPIALIKDENLNDSVFEMCGIDIEHTSHPALHQLLNQRRSNERIVKLINDVFYEKKLIPTISGSNDIIESEPYSGKIVAVDSVTDGEVRFTKGGTRQNVRFAENDVRLLDEFAKKKYAAFSIGIITPYKGQVSLIRRFVHDRHYSDTFSSRIKVGTVHTFQGSECDVIIYDVVECGKLENGKKNNIGKIYAGSEGERLLNVAVSRARHKLIVVCDPSYIKDIPGYTVTDKTRDIFDKIRRTY